MTRRPRQSLTALVIALVAGATAFVGVNQAGAPVAQRAPSGGELPTLAAGFERFHTLPENGGMAGPWSAAQAEFLERAYPANNISIAEVDAAKAAFTRADGRNHPRGHNKRNEWDSVGPSRSLYPDSPFRNAQHQPAVDYVTNEYIAGGRTTAISLSERCRRGRCVAYVTPAGGGIWRTRDVLARNVRWEYLGGPLGINAAGAVTIDEHDPSGNTVYVGTGEANICGSGCVAGVGLYKSTDGGEHWKGPLGKAELAGKGIGEIVIDPRDRKTLYVGTTTALTGMSSVCCSGVTRPTPDAAKWGLYKSTDGGSNWTFIHNGSVNVADCLGDISEFNNAEICSPRGVRHVELDPNDPDIVYASSYARGVWRSPDGGATWTQIKPSLNPAIIQTRAAIDVAELQNGDTRMYVYEGNIGAPFSRLFRSDSVATGAPTFTDLTSSNPADPGFAWFNLCTGQCWYDVFVYTPPGYPDIVYAGGSYSYGQTIANRRGVVLSTDAGATGTDMTWDGTSQDHPNSLHPDQHDMVTVPGDPFRFIETNDGGVMRSSGEFVNRSAWCDDPNRGLSGATLDRCRQMLSRIPSRLTGLNDGLNTLQFQSLSVSPHDSEELQGGTQDNGTWENYGRTRQWRNTMIGDGGQSGFDVEVEKFRFHTFTGTSIDVNFNNGAMADWIFIGGNMGGDAGTQFYAPVISDPAVSGTMFAGTGVTAYRTKTFGLGNRTLEEANRVCNEWFGTGPGSACGDWARLGPTPLTDPAWGDRAGPAVAAVERTPGDTSTGWAATTTGRVFISTNVDAEPASAVTWTRLDDDAVTPNRFVSSIYVDPDDGNHAWVSYSGYNVNTPATPGHVFEVTFDPATGTSTWVDRSFDLGDLPITDLVLDDRTGDLFAGTDFGVLRLAAGTTTWTRAARGMPNVEIAGLTIVPDERILYAASHGLSAWRLDLRR